MPDDKSLLSYVVRRYTTSTEDAATDALFFILSRSTSAKQALSDFLSEDGAPLSIAKVQPQSLDAFGAIPDLTCLDNDDNILALIESKFRAPLTPHQPVTYWKNLPVDKPSALLFLAPKSRVEDSELWGALVGRLNDAGHELGPADRNDTRITAVSKKDSRRLMLTSWHSLLDVMAYKVDQDGNAQAVFEIAELQGLAADVITKGNPVRDENLKRLMADAVNRLVLLGWANTDELGTGGGFGYYHRYHYLAGAGAALRIDYNAIKESPDKPLWLRFGNFVTNPTITTAQVSSILERANEPGWKLYGREKSLPIELPAGADHDETLDAIVAQMERIAKIIDPNGPTYPK